MNSPRRADSVVWPGGPSLNGPHAVGAFSLCPQLHAYGHEMHLRPVIDKPAPAIGTLAHAGVAYHYAALLPTRPEWFVYKDGHEAIDRLGAPTPEYRDLAHIIFAAYVEHYRTRETWTPILVEHQFVVDFPPWGKYSARTDLLAREPDGSLSLVDHKFLKQLTDTIRAEYSTDRQMLTGLAIARANGYDVQRVIVNVGTREMPVPQFRRYEIPINHEAFDRMGADTLYYIKRQAETRAEYPDPTNRPRNLDACLNRKFGPCEYYGLCFHNPKPWHQFHVPSEYQDGRKAQGT